MSKTGIDIEYSEEALVNNSSFYHLSPSNGKNYKFNVAIDTTQVKKLL